LDVRIAGSDASRAGRFQFTNRDASTNPNTGGNCESTTLYVRNVKAEWYGDDNSPDDPPSLADLVRGGTRHPSGNIGQGPTSATSIPAGGSDIVKVSIGQPSGKTGHIAIIYDVGTSPTPDPNTDNTEYALLPLSFPDPGKPSIPTLSEWGMITLVMLLVLTGGLLIRRRSNRTTAT